MSVVVPAHDEAPSLEALHERLTQVLPPGGEVLYVDDGSRDATPEVLARLAAADSRVRAFRLERRFGKSVALLAGFRRARGRAIVTLDADLQDDPAEIPRLLARLEDGFDLVGAWRRDRRDPPLKVLGSRAFNRFVSLVAGTRFRDINCGLKAMRREVVDELVSTDGFHRFIPLVASWKGFRVSEEPVAHAARRHGKSRYGAGRGLQAFLDLLVIVYLVRYEGRPSRLFLALGGLLSLGGLGVSAYLAFLRLSTGSIQSRFPLLALGLVLLVVGVQLFSLGLFAELLAHPLRVGSTLEPRVQELTGRGARDAAEPPAGREGAADGRRHG